MVSQRQQKPFQASGHAARYRYSIIESFTDRLPFDMMSVSFRAISIAFHGVVFVSDRITVK